jgi:hypothetical protein
MSTPSNTSLPFLPASVRSSPLCVIGYPDSEDLNVEPSGNRRPVREPESAQLTDSMDRR